jgi:oligopeptide/dipeptide ABC transporter ATP-binding protein
MDLPFLQVQGLAKNFELAGGLFGKKKLVHAVDDVSFDLQELETLGIVGESGSGKSTLGRLILRLIEPTSGEVRFMGQDVLHGDERQIRRNMQMVFQDPYASLNPRFRIGNALAEPMLAQGVVSNAKEADERVGYLLSMVGLQPEMAKAYPHQFSGGQRQRISIARALGLNPKLLICDEAVSALDVSVQAQILNLFNRLKTELKLTYLFISHDLAVVKYISDRVMVMYLGEVMEWAPADQLFAAPLHPYTIALLSAIPDPALRGRKKRMILSGEIPSPMNPPSGCKFRTRCFKATAECETTHPQVSEVQPNHFVRCLLYP